MKLTKKLETEIRGVMEDYWQSYLEGDLTHWEKYLVDDYRNIGGTEEEVWNSKKEILDYTHRIIDQMVGVSELRNKKIEIIPLDPYIMVHEFMDIYIKIEEEWSFYQKFRLSTIIRHTTEGWKVLHQHGSYPDAKAQDGEAFAFDTLKAENVKLQEAVKERTIELQEKNRELEIETALDRVRARTMAMQTSRELPEAANLLFQQIQLLGMPAWSAGYCVWDEDKNGITAWMSSEGVLQPPFHAPLTKDPLFKTIRKAYDQGESFAVVEMGGYELVEHYKYMRTLPVVGEILDAIVAAGHPLPGFQIMHYCFFSEGLLLFITYERVPLAHDIFKRFTKVFEQTYTRFLDLQKAEAQTREAEIELALERVRARTMAMQKSEELKEVIQLVYTQFVQLKIHIEHTGFILDYQERADMHIWMADQHEVPAELFLPYFDCAHWNSFNKAKAAGGRFFANHLSFEEKNKFYRDLFELIPGVPQETIDYYLSSKGLAISTVLLDDVGLYIENFDGIPYMEEENKTLMRFGKVFQQTYTRFQDLQKAEEQAKEAKIEAALERVRSRSLAMHHSSELSAVVDTLLKEFTNLEFTLTFCIINLINEEDKSNTVWAANPEEGKAPESYYMKFEDYPFHFAMWDAWKAQNKRFIYTIAGEEKTIYDKYLYSETEFRRFPQHVKDANMALERYVAGFTFFKYSGLQTVSVNPISEEDLSILERFGRVFEQSYTRFLDLQKAEAQANEAQIEAALERVRSRSLAMHSSEELLDVIDIISDQILQQGLKFDSISFGTNDQGGTFRFWLDSPGQPHPILMEIPAIDNPAQIRVLEKQQEGVEFFADILSREENIEWISHLIKHSDFKHFPSKIQQYMLRQQGFWRSTFLLQNINFLVTNYRGQPFSDKENAIFKRFALVFEQAYTRFLDLQKAEAQAREALVEAGLERVRSRTLAMQKSEELAETSVVVFQELLKLGIEPNRLFIGIMKDDTSEIEAWATNEDGSRIGNHFTLVAERNASVKKMYNGWKNKSTSLTIDMEGEELKNYFHYLADELQIPFKGGLSQKKRVQTIAYFSQGLIGMASPDEQPEATLRLLERFAAVFNLTYTRFNDLKIAEAHAMQAEEDLIKLQTEKKRAEEALNVLQVTQKQLIQSEKMASLGELTAGIAHEIQNPLNFVNNFSEVSKELLDEMQVAMQTGDNGEVMEIMKDVMENLEKINLHGRRADSIVKGMLQHSRKTQGQKELSSINALCDEYLRLSYHGLRAKNKSFNATMNTDFDPSIGTISIMPQDIGRVILNVINNAFYAVSAAAMEKADSGFQPTVWVSTKKTGDKVSISVKDNGIGIPKNIVDKIFQPFFTTKPTGQGTGLGLSLSYDIIKAHGGTINLIAKENEGTEFIIQLPIS